MKFYGGVLGGTRNKQLNFGGDLDYHADGPMLTLSIANPGNVHI